MRNCARSSPSGRSLTEASSSLNRSRSVGCICFVKSSSLVDRTPGLRPNVASTTGLTLISSRRSFHSHTPAPPPPTPTPPTPPPPPPTPHTPPPPPHPPSPPAPPPPTPPPTT